MFVIILTVAGFFGLKYYLGEKQKELYKEEMNYYYSKGEEYLSNKEYEKAIKMFKKVNEDSDKYKDANTKIEETTKVYIEDYVSEAEKLVEQKEYDKAVSVFDELSDELKNTEEVKNAIADIVIKKVENEISELENLYEQIIAINDETKKSSDDITIEEKLEELLDKKVDLYIEELEKELTTKNYEDYKKQIERISGSVGSDSEIYTKINETFEKYSPKKLLSLEFEKDDKVVTSKDENSYYIIDSKGKHHTEYIFVDSSDKEQENTMTWNIDKNYSTLSGKIVLGKDVQKDAKGVKITIKGDGKTIYKSKKIKSTTAPFDFSVDVSGVKELKIILESNKGIPYIIVDPMISK